MRIRLKQEIISTIGYLKPGTVIELADHIAKEWIKQGKAMEDKSYEPKEVKRDYIKRKSKRASKPSTDKKNNQNK